ncbi:MAG: sulfate/molybdate ABC transporter ATP-binding protein [Clostridiales bacterium]|jgi:molybdate transport system ATP-binding protein|nr:sulfate/molybdate ABC transporter ATP-binding protein [Eubacteriales bacterium]MDH7566075.1 sulfate/molybdate ABC transporter ATP-binding protein [Clostridiales bacterium]
MGLFVDIKKRLPGFTLEAGFESGAEVLGLLGASGSGKSMTLRCIAGIVKPDKGRIVLNGRVLFDSDKGVNVPCRQRKIGFLFQNYALFPNMTVEENIAFGLQNLDREQKNRIIRANVQMMKLEGLEKRYPFQLSGGQQQRVALARALAIEPEALLLDEPFSALDEHLRSHMQKQFMDTLDHYRGVTLFVTHNIEEAYGLCGKLVVLSGGKVGAEGLKENMFLKPPSLETAQLTGCKNFSAVRRLSANEWEALDWGIRLKVEEEPEERVSHMGIHAHHIRLARREDTENIFKCWPAFTSESPFKMTVYISVGRKPLSPEDYHLQWEIAKERWHELKDRPLPWDICLEPGKLMLLKDK